MEPYVNELRTLVIISGKIWFDQPKSEERDLFKNSSLLKGIIYKPHFINNVTSNKNLRKQKKTLLL